jgi:hypothetical protein
MPVRHSARAWTARSRVSSRPRPVATVRVAQSQQQRAAV